MLKKTLAVLLAMAPLSIAAAHAQSEPNSYDKLKRVLERKFTPPPQQNQQLEGGTRGLEVPRPVTAAPPPPANAPQTSGETRSLSQQPAATSRSLNLAPKPVAQQPALKRAFNWLKVKSANGRKDPKIKAPADIEKRGDAKPASTFMMQADASWLDAAKSLFTGLFSANASKPAAPLALAAMSSGAEAAGGTIELAQDVAPDSETSAAPADVEAPVSRPNSYVIQLKPEASEEDIGKLLEKYNLNVTKVIGELGVITVESNDGASRGLDDPAAAPEAEAPSTPEEA